MSTEWFHIDNPGNIDSPALIVFPEIVRQNIQTAIAMAGDVQRLRPHIKTSKSPDVVRLMLEAGIRKFKCATIAEAEMLGLCGAPDVLLAYQPTGPKLERLAALIKAYPNTQYACLTDNIETASGQDAVFRTAGVRVPVYLDIDIGMHRTGIAPEQGALELYAFCTERAQGAGGIEVRGLHAYDGHIRNADFAAKKAACDTAFERVEKLLDAIREAGLPEPVIVAGGSPTFSVHCRRPGIECSPGTFVYWDKGYADLCPEQAFLPAAVLLTRIISKPAENLLTTDLGHKSVAAENPLDRRVYFPQEQTFKPVGQSEEHLVLETDEAGDYRVGDLLYGIPYHICPTVALYERVLTAEAGAMTGEWWTLARDRRIGV